MPKSISKICDLLLNKEENEAYLLNKENKNLYDLLFIESNPSPVKWMLYKMGKIEKSIRLPLVSLDTKYKDNIIAEMLKLNLL